MARDFKGAMNGDGVLGLGGAVRWGFVAGVAGGVTRATLRSFPPLRGGKERRNGNACRATPARHEPHTLHRAFAFDLAFEAVAHPRQAESTPGLSGTAREGPTFPRLRS
jgi:hypothetical protein